jgi:predicted nucleotidyltransferase
MLPDKSDTEILSRYRAALDRLYGDRIERVVLFGSRARGDAQTDSDYDVAVFLRSMAPGMEEPFRLADLRLEFLDNSGTFFEAFPLPAGSWQERTPLMHEIRKDGIDL